MLIVLPPSETKTRPTDPTAPTVDLGAFSQPSLRMARETMLRAAVRTAQGSNGAAMIGVPPSAPELLSRMASLPTEPVGPPLEVYTGVLFDALGPVALPTGEGAADGAQVLIASALFGLVDAAKDLIPAYRLSAGSTVEGLGKVGSWWKPHLAPLAEAYCKENSVVVDCRSGAYTSMMPLRAAHVLEVSPVMEREGQRKVVSHDAKRYRGVVAKALLEAAAAGSCAQHPAEVVELLRTVCGDSLGIELRESTSPTRPSTLTVVDYWERREAK